MTPAILIQLLLQLGTVGIPLIVKLKADMDAGKAATSVTEADLTELARLSAQTSADIYRKLGIALPPPV